MNLLILSELKAGYTQVGWAISHSLESVLAELCQPTFLYPTANPWAQQARSIGQTLELRPERVEFLERCANRLRPPYHLSELPRLSQTQVPNVLLLLGLLPEFLNSVQTLEPLLSQFDLRLAYLMDGFAPNWLNPSLLPKFDHLFVLSHELAHALQQSGVSASFLPLAINTASFQVQDAPRWIDVIGYGRTDAAVHQVLQRQFNQPTSPRLYLHSTFSHGEVFDQREHDMLMCKLLSQSKISLCFEASGIRRFWGTSPLLYRWLEAWAAGCTVVGRKPFGAGVAELMDWPNSAIDLPEASADWLSFIEALLDAPESLAENARRNRQQCLLRHDWHYRIKTMLETVDLPIPDQLNARIANLQQQASAVGQ